jgi:hypothetical protein
VLRVLRVLGVLRVLSAQGYYLDAGELQHLLRGDGGDDAGTTRGRDEADGD